MSLIPENLSKHSSPFLKGEDFEGAGQTLIIRGFSVKVADNAEYGADENNALFKQGKLELGQTMRYEFETEDGEEKVFESTSPGFFIAFNKLVPEGGETVRITREGKAMKTRYAITKIA
jgi:hypothetical protein